MLSFPRLVLSATLLLGASCGANDTPTRPAARLTQLKPFAEPRIRPRETIIRGLLASLLIGSAVKAEGVVRQANSALREAAVQRDRPAVDRANNVPLGLRLVRIMGIVAVFLATDGSAVGCQPADAISSSSRASSTAKSSATKNSSSRVTSTPFSASESPGASSGSSATANSAGTASGVSSSTPSTSKRAATPVGRIAGGVVGGVAVLATVVGIFIFCRRRRPGYHGRLPDELTPYSMPANQQTGADYAPHRGSTHTHSVLTRLPSGAVMMSPSGNSAHEPPHRAPVFDVTSTESPGTRTRSQLLRARQSELERQTREINRELEELRHGDVPSASSSIVASRGDSDAQRDIKMMEDQMRTSQRRQTTAPLPWAQELSNEAPPSYSSF
ncbi:hypothetical protein B0H14DRAFT_2592524 [Mycena olivaceomarginata]|nr:hypothetical protein B0H14DRAFT_2592524 [Mycena olivaceomarginata]